MRYFILASTLLFTFIHSNANAIAACEPLDIKSENKEIILPGPDDSKTNKIYFFKNLTDKSIWIDHPVLHPSMSAGWSSYLRKNNASALLVNKKDFNISCAVIKPG